MYIVCHMVLLSVPYVEWNHVISFIETKMASGKANAHTMKKKVVLESDLPGERAEW